MMNPKEDPTMEICPCTIDAVHTAWNCPTCKGKGWIKDSDHVAEISSVIDELAKDPAMRQRSMRERVKLQKISAKDLYKKFTI